MSAIVGQTNIIAQADEIIRKISSGEERLVNTLETREVQLLISDVGGLLAEINKLKRYNRPYLSEATDLVEIHDNLNGSGCIERTTNPNLAKEIETIRVELQSLRNKVEIVEQSQKVQKETVELATKKTDQLSSDVGKVSEWAKKREQDFLDIESIAEDLKEEEKEKEKFRNDNQ